MSRKLRQIAPLLHSLLFGAALTSGVMLAAGSLAGCADENEPSTHVKKLSDPATREPFRSVNFLHDVAAASIVGQGKRGYLLALESIAARYPGAAGG